MVKSYVLYNKRSISNGKLIPSFWGSEALILKTVNNESFCRFKPEKVDIQWY